MRIKTFIFGLMAMLALSFSQPQLSAATKAEKKEKHHKDSSSSHKHDSKKKKCCNKALKMLDKIDQTTIQDLIVDQTTLGLASQINQTTRADLAVDEKILDIVTNIKDCACKCQLILPRDFEDSDGNLTQTYVITAPGSYCLGADVAFAPEDDFVPPIQILSDNVNLDLGGFRLDQTSNVLGLAIAIGFGERYLDPDYVLKNISITNGSITNFKGCAIHCYNSTFDANPYAVGKPYESLKFSNLDILDCGSSPNVFFASGIELAANGGFYQVTEDFFPVAYKDVVIDQCRINRSLGNGAIAITYCII